MKTLLTISLLIFNLTFAFAQDDFEASINNYVSLHTDRANDLISNRDKVVGVELIIAGRSLTLASSFGHAMIRFIYKDAQSTDNTIVSFVARPEDEIFSTWKAATSKYTFIPEIMSVQDIWIKYNENQNRDLTRYALDLSPEQLSQFIDVSTLYIQNPERLKGYNFFKNNCMVAISKILIEAGLTKKEKKAIFPNKAHKWLKKNNLISLPAINMTSSVISIQE